MQTTDISCEFIKHEGEYSGAYECSVVSERIEASAVNFKGNHADNCTNNDITHFTAWRCVFSKFPPTVQLSFPSLTCLSILSCHLETLEREALCEMPNLVELGVIDCGLRALPGDLLKDLAKLEKISFLDNRIDEIGDGLLDGLERLNFADFRGNLCINLFYDEDNASGDSLAEIKRVIAEKSSRKLAEYSLD